MLFGQRQKTVARLSRPQNSFNLQQHHERSVTYGKRVWWLNSARMLGGLAVGPLSIVCLEPRAMDDALVNALVEQVLVD